MRTSRIIHEERGAAAIEFAVVTVFLLMIISGVVAYGNTLTQLEVLTGAAREGARTAAIGGSNAAIVERVNDAVGPYGPIENVSVTVNGSGADPACEPNPGESVQVAWPQDLQIEILGLPVINRETEIRAVFRCE